MSRPTAEGDNWTTGKCILRRARNRLSDILPIASVIREQDHSPELHKDYEARVDAFNKGIQQLNSRLATPETIPPYFQNMRALAGLLPNMLLPDFQEVGDILQVNNELAREASERRLSKDDLPSQLVYADVREKVSDTFDDVAARAKLGTWDFVYKVRDPRQLISTLLIEGGGAFYDSFFGTHEIARPFVLAFEEALFAHGSRVLIPDVLDWMIEEKGNFSPGMAAHLELLSTLPRTREAQYNQLPRSSQVRHAVASNQQLLVVAALAKKGIQTTYVHSSALNDAKLQERKEGEVPLKDVFSVKVEVQSDEVKPAAAAIRAHYKTPPVLPSGEGTIRVMRDRSIHVYAIFPDQAGKNQIEDIHITPKL